MKTTRWMVVGVVPVLALALAAGIGGAAQDKIYQVVATANNNMNHVPSFVGVEKGIFLKHGIDLKLKVLSTGQEQTRAVQAGEAQFLGPAYSNFPLALERGFKAKGFVGLVGDRTRKYSDEQLAILTRKGTGITKIQDLVGKRVGTVVGGTSHEYLGVVLAKAGIPAEKVPVLNVPPGNSVSALAGGQVDAMSVWEPYGVLILEKVPDAVVLQQGGGFLGYFIDMSTPVDIMEKQPDMVYRYTVGLVEASQYTRQHMDEAAEIATRWIPGLEVAVAQKAIRKMPYDPRITKYTLESWDENVRVLVEQKKMRQPIPWAQGTELKFIEQAQKEYPQLFSDLKPVP